MRIVHFEKEGVPGIAANDGAGWPYQGRRRLSRYFARTDCARRRSVAWRQSASAHACHRLERSSDTASHREPIRRPRESSALDYEAELAVVIGRRGRRIHRDRALDHVAGYSLFNDATIRDFQLRTPQWTMGKNFDGTGAFGPWLVTPDAVPPGAQGLRIQGRLKSRVMQESRTDRLIFSVPVLIELISVAITLEPGDVIITGTPGGVGAARKPAVYMQPGDVFEVEIEGMGVLSNSVQIES